MPLFKKQKKEGKPKIEVLAREKVITFLDVIAPSSIDVESNYLKIGEKFARSYFVLTYPSTLVQNWLSPIINLDKPLDISIFIYPIDTSTILKKLQRKITEVQALIMEREEKGYVRDPQLEAAYKNIEELRDKLVRVEEKMFKFGLYLTLYADSLEELNKTEKEVRQLFESQLVYIKPSLFKQKEGFFSSLPLNLDQLLINTSLNTGPTSACFPFTSFELTSERGILYGINQHNNSLIIFDRFSLENGNVVIFAKSGSGKSYFQKLEILRSLIQGVDVIVVDPENEYQYLAQVVGGSYFKISLASPHRINPLDLPLPIEGETPESIFRSHIITLIGLFRIMLGGMTPEEDAIMDQALTLTYASRDITPESDFYNKTPPLLSDLEAVLRGMEGGESLAQRLQKYTTGAYSGLLNHPTNVSLKERLVVFSIRDLEEELRPIAMYLILRYIWNIVRSKLKKRILVIDEAWWMMKYEDGASFLFGMCKRSRKYYLGVSTITQDVNDFMSSPYGQPIVANSSLQILLKQSPATIDTVARTFNLTEEEKMRLLQAEVGEGLFFAGAKHVAIKVVASYAEDQIITTDPEQLLKIKKAKEEFGE
jgi:type IV secretory pathway VirB4 component